MRLPDTGAQLLGNVGIDRIFRETVETTRESIFQSYLAYYDGPVQEPNLCGIAFGKEEFAELAARATGK